MQTSPESDSTQLHLARVQGEVLQRTLSYMMQQVAHDGREVRAGEYRVAYAVETAERLYQMQDGKLEWEEPTEENAHIEIAVCDGADGR